MQYSYSSLVNGRAVNNGRITQSTDNGTGETVNYTYDALNRLIGAQATSGGWGETYSYDGFGNMGSYFGLNNQPGGLGFDANGNETSYGYTWDMENRLVMGVYGVTWAYDPHGKRVFTETNTFGQGGAPCELDFYGIGGKKLAAFGCQYDDNGIFSWSPPTYNVYFGKKLIRSKSLTVVTDRLGSVRGTSNNENMRYASYGSERTSTADGREKWGTYFRDVGTGLDYADQRYKGVGMGAFLNPDPGGIATASPKNPGSWNRYAYVLGDPINGRDPTGRIEIICSDPDADSIYDASCYGDGGGFDDGGGGGGDLCYGSYFDPTPNPACYAPVPAPPAGPPPAPPPLMYVMATSDCYTINMASAKGKTVWERDITYSAYLVYANGTSTNLSVGSASGAVIQEVLTQTQAQTGTPGPASASGPGQPFQDTISAGTTGPFQVTQTFTVQYGGVTYNAQIQSIQNQVTSSNLLNVQLGSISVNGNTNIQPSGKNKGKRPLCSGGYQ